MTPEEQERARKKRKESVQHSSPIPPMLFIDQVHAVIDSSPILIHQPTMPSDPSSATRLGADPFPMDGNAIAAPVQTLGHEEMREQDNVDHNAAKRQESERHDP